MSTDVGEAQAPVQQQGPDYYRAIYRAMTTPQLITEAWETQTDPALRNEIMGILATRQLTEGAAAWPSAAMAAREEMAGLYPDPEDPEFAARLYGKREFYESRAVAAGVAEGTIDPCSSAAAERVFELTPVQRIVSRFLHPLTPYMGMLIDHGVGVGKTCTAVTIAEQFLEIAPGRKVIVVAPQALHDNFRKTIFDPAKLVWDEEEGRWTTQQCTGTSYLERLDLMTTPDIKTVTFKVEEERRSRYKIVGYLALANWIKTTLGQKIPASLTGEARIALENEALRALFSDHLIIIDEAHNLRDTSVSVEEATDPAPAESAAEDEADENAAGKALNPWLRRICLGAEGMRLVLMTATPMYNAAPEICLLLNYLILNDEKSDRRILDPTRLFTREGDLIAGAPTRALARIARRYVTYMRGENPFTFPLRMRPLVATDDAVERWPERSASKRPVDLSDEEKSVIGALPFVFTEPEADSPPEELLRGAKGLVSVADGSAEGAEEEALTITDAMLGDRMQIANITYPNMTFGGDGWASYFTQRSMEEAVAVPGTTKTRSRTVHYYVPRADTFDVDSVFGDAGLRVYAPKMQRIVKSVTSAKGICFVYTQYVSGGALPLAVALERAGFQRRMADGRIVPLVRFQDPKMRVPPICAICGQQRGAAIHGSDDHPFKPACYVLLTSDEQISPSFSGLVRQASSWPAADGIWGPMGSNVKVIIGSRVASEGLDLKCIREMHIMDAWYHLNRVEQIIGRAIRYCSHAALRTVEKDMALPSMSLNNCLIYLHAVRLPNRGPAKPAIESADMYAYRIAIAKALMVGRVQRLLKTNAWDCNLELEAIIFAGLPPRPQIDAQGNNRRSLGADGQELDGYSINDQDYTTYCDYQVCDHTCAVSVPRTPEDGLHLDSSTFTVSDARRLVLDKQQYVRAMFQDNVVVPESTVQKPFESLPYEIRTEALMELLDGRRFRVRRPDGVEGFLVKKAGYVVFQPALVTDTDIPMTMRYARAFQLRREFMTSPMSVFGRGRVEEAPKLTQAQAPVPTPAPTMTSTAVAQDAEQAAVAVAEDGVLAKWAEWLTFVSSGGAVPLPKSMPGLFAFLMQRYAAIPESQTVALRWWYDRQSMADQRTLLAAALDGDTTNPVIARLATTVANDIYRSDVTMAYRVFNPVSMSTEYYCRSVTKGNAAAVGAYTPCDSAFVKFLTTRLDSPPVRFLDEGAAGANVGALVGFMAPKKGVLVFKTLDTTKPLRHYPKKEKPVQIGAECGNVSNLQEHQERVRDLQQAARASGDAQLVEIMLRDEDASWNKVGVEDRRDTPTHMKDLTHQPLCLYMEWLTRILEARRIGGVRWFLTPATAAASGLKGRA